MLIENRGGDGELGAGIDFPEQARQFPFAVEVRRIDSHSGKEPSGAADDVTADVLPVVEADEEVDGADGIHVEIHRCVHAWGGWLTGDDQDVGNARGVADPFVKYLTGRGRIGRDARIGQVDVVDVDVVTVADPVVEFLSRRRGVDELIDQVPMNKVMSYIPVLCSSTTPKINMLIDVNHQCLRAG